MDRIKVHESLWSSAVNPKTDNLKEIRRLNHHQGVSQWWNHKENVMMERESVRQTGTERGRSELSRQRKGRINKVFFFYLYCLSLSFSSQLSFLWSLEKRSADAIFKAATNICRYSATSQPEPFIRSLMAKRITFKTWNIFFFSWLFFLATCFLLLVSLLTALTSHFLSFICQPAEWWSYCIL